MTCAGLLLTGGSSRRMGRDKAALVVDGRPLAHRTADLLSACRPVLEVGPGYSGLDAVLEPQPGTGPLQAIAAGWEALQGRRWRGPVLVVATDLPRLNERMVTWLVGHRAPGSVVPCSGGRAQPLCARWSAPDLDRAAALAAAGRRSLGDLLEATAPHLAGADEWSGPAGGSDVLDDVDTPQDLERLGLGSAARPGEEPVVRC